jgi:FkbM family methyltransferase
VNNILKIRFDKNSGSFDFECITDTEFLGDIVISDLYLDCSYYTWENLQFNREFKGWISPLSEKLMKVVLNNNQYPGFIFKIYGPNKRLLQSEKFYLNNSDPIIKTPFVTPSHDMVGPSYVDFFYSDLCKGIDFSGVVIDAGANVGFFTLLADAKGAKRVYSIEPDPEAFHCLHKNFMNHSNVICVNKALHDKIELALFDLGLGTSVASTISTYNTQFEKHTIFVETITISSLLLIEDRIDLLKLDIEGAEYAVLRNLPSYYYDKIDQFFIEFHGDPKYIFQKLVKEGYEPEYRDSDENSTAGFIYAKKL